jgi:hypothetical protein
MGLVHNIISWRDHALAEDIQMCSPETNGDIVLPHGLLSSVTNPLRRMDG